VMFRARPGDCFRLSPGHGCGPRVAAGEARGSTAAVPRARGDSSFPVGGFRAAGSGEAGRELGDLGFPGYGCLGRGGVREFRACFLRAPGVPLAAGDVQGAQDGAGGVIPRCGNGIQR